MTEMNRSVQRRTVLCLTFCTCAWLGAGPVLAERLPAAGWAVRDDRGRAVAAATDNNLDTAWTSDRPQTPGMAIEIDLRREALIHRLYLTPGAQVMNFPRSLRVFFSTTPTRCFANPWEGVTPLTQNPVVEAVVTSGNRETSLKFAPVRARYLRIEIGPDASGLPWSIAELELYGSTDEAAFAKGDAVVVDPNAPFPLQLAARELQYYVGELTGRPLPVIAPAEENAYPGTLYKVVDLAPLAKTFEEMAANRKAGLLPEGVNVERQGRAVLFKAFPYEMTLSSVWEFLESQGVRWVYPEPQGDFVPAGRGVNLDVLPIRYVPPTAWRYANFGTQFFDERPLGDRYMYFWRNRWNSSWGGAFRSILGGAEVPVRDPAKYPVVGKGFEGYPHNFASVIPDDVLRAHPDWCGMLQNTRNPNTCQGVLDPSERKSPGQGGPTFCMSNPALIDWVAQKALDSAGGNANAEGTIRLLPMDSALFCECDNCMKLYEPLEPESLCFEWGGRMNVSDAFYHFISEVARRIGEKLPNVEVKCLAYANYHKPPRKIKKMPDNVRVQVCLYGAMTLPLSHPRNAAMRQRLEEWHAKCPRLDTYSYVLIHAGRMPVPLVTPMSDWMRTLAQHGALGGGSQASEEHLPINPWNFYAFPRYVWRPDTAPEEILGDFFHAYYRESGDAMLAWYKALENHVLKEGVDMQEGMYGYGPKPEAFTEDVLREMEQDLKKAEKQATSWVVKKRLQVARESFEWARAQSGYRRADPQDAQARGKRSYPVHRIAGPVKIDGVLDDAAWTRHPAATGFSLPGSNRLAIVRQTEFRMAWDDEKLYVAVRCREPDAARIDVKDKKKAAFFSDSVEIFFAPKLGSPTRYYRLALSASGIVEGPHLYLGDMYGRVKEEPPPIESAARVEGGAWVCEAAIPFALLGGKPETGAAWLGNVCRNTRVVGDTGEQYTSWSALPFLNWHNYREYNSLEFKGDTMSAEQARAVQEKMNGEFQRAHGVLVGRWDAVQEVITAAAGARDLVLPEKDAPRDKAPQLRQTGGLMLPEGWLVQNVGPQWYQVTWPQPVACDAALVRFDGRYSLPQSYSLEAWDGERWQLLARESDNEMETRAHRFPRVTATALRLYIYEPDEGQRQVRSLSVYDLGGKGR